MSWASKANNQWQTVGDVSGAIPGTLTAIGSAPSGKASNQYITYAEFIAWVQTSGLASSSRWVTKTAVLPYINLPLPYSFSIIVDWDYSNDWYQGWATSADACTHSGGYAVTVYSASSTITS